MLETNAFASMHNLRLLQLNHVQFTGSYEEFPKRLRWLYWRGFPLRSIPSDFSLESLVVLDMQYSCLKQVWKGNKVLGLLKILNLSHSHSLIRTTNFSLLPNLERLILKDCISLVEIDESIGNLEGLVPLNLTNCKKLRKLLRNIGMLKFLETLVISGCSNLDQLTTELKKMESLKVLFADGIDINKVQRWHALSWSWVSKSPKISWGSLPCSLVSLSLMDCNLSDDAFSMDFSNLSLLHYLNLRNNPFCSLPESLRHLTRLQQLNVSLCTRLKSLLCPPSIIDLSVNQCTSLERVSFDSFQSTPSRLLLTVGDCDDLVEIEGRFKLEPIKNIDAEMLNNLGFLNLESMRKVEVTVEHFGNIGRKKLPLQGLFEPGIFSTYIPGNNVPSWFSHKSRGSSISFTVPSLANLSIRGLNVCSVYTFPGNRDTHCGLHTTIDNKWIHRPWFLGIPEDNGGMIWLSHWKFGNLLQGGDEVEVSVESNCFRVEEVGIQLLYHKDEEKKGTHQQTDLYQDFIPGDVSHQSVWYEEKKGTHQQTDPCQHYIPGDVSEYSVLYEFPD